MQPRLPADSRLSALAATDLVDAPPSPTLDGLTRIAARVLSAPVALVSLVDAHRQWFAGLTGLTGPAADERSTPLSRSFCQHVVAQSAPLLIPDSRLDPLVA
ncbi:MAG TPA: hypothetical protein VE869_12290, partial [Gemmatimonas sp.]|nr:hypothetical protein [Gemmatimonas sp.]